MIARHSARLILIPFIIGVIISVPGLMLMSFKPFIYSISMAFILFSMALLVFFRDPEREIGDGLVSPADGRVLSVSDTDIMIYMSPLDVHVNRAPLSGRVTATEHMAGGHAPAFISRAAENERLVIDMATDIGTLKLVQIAGTFARRIESYVKVGEALGKGERIGIVRFGSRVELHLPKDKIRFVVSTGDKVKAGSTIGEILG